MNILTRILACYGITDVHAYSVSPEGKRISTYREHIFRDPKEVDRKLSSLRFL